MKKKKIISGLAIALGILVSLGTNSASAGEEVNIKPELTVYSNDKDNSISLSWSMGGLNDKYSYMIYSKDSKETNFQSIPAKATAKVLNIYPNAGNNLKTWMETNGYGKGLISVVPVNINDFNKKPSTYLKDSNGNWKYDVIMLGSWDGNNDLNLNDNAVNVVKQFIDSGRGILAGHDTIGCAWGTNRGLGKIRDRFNIKVGHWRSPGIPTDEGHNYHGGFISDKAILRRKGLLTNYPWNLGEVGKVFSVPVSHSTSNFAYGDIWMTYPDNALVSDSQMPVSLYKYSNYYLTTWNNTAMIQTGHSNGAATPDEQKILANTLFYLSQVTEETNWTDHKGQDLVAPNQPLNVHASRDFDGNINISFDKASDIGNTYQYYIEATEKATGNKVKSDTKSVTLTSGIKGYSISVDENPNGVPDKKITTTENKFTINKKVKSPFYVHVTATDNAGNVSKVSTYKCDYPTLQLTASTIEKTHNPVTITAKATSTESSIKEIKLPNGKIVEGSNAEYKVEENGTYTFEVTDIEGRKTRESIVVNNILMPLVLNVELPKSEVKVNDEVEVYLSINNVTDIKSEEATIKYDAAKLQFLSMEKTDGQRFIRTRKTAGEIKVTLSNVGKETILSNHKVLLKMKFKAKDLGKTLVYVKGGKISNGLNMERDLLKDECGEEILTIN